METPKTPERLMVDQEVVIALKNGFDNPETQLIYNKWLDQLEAERTEDSLYDIKVSIRRAKVYYKAGFRDEAIADLHETMEAAFNEKDGTERRELMVEITLLMDSMLNTEEI